MALRLVERPFSLEYRGVMSRYALALTFAIGAVASTSGGAAVQTADEVIEKHLAALGGRSALEKLTTRRATGTVTITTPNGNLAGPIEISNKSPNKTLALMTLDLSAVGVSDTMTLQQKFDGTAGWMINSLQGDTPITGNQLENMRNATFPSPLLNYKGAGTRVELLPRATVAGTEYLALRLTPKSGSVVTHYLDPSTYLVMRSAAKVNSPDFGDLDNTSEISDYRDVSGIKVPFHVVNANQAQSITIKIDKVEHNVPLDDAIFSAKPPRP
jgi:outer membrane lipoprotein-sorting protein